jgi:YfiH family protein
MHELDTGCALRVTEPFWLQGDHLAIDLHGARAVFTTRRGGCSAGAYASLNLGRFTDDDPAAVERNRAALERELGVPFAYGRQVHGARVMRTTAAPDGSAARVEADGHATAGRAVAPMVLTADCLPVAVAGQDAVAMLHAGWRGLAAGILTEGVRAVRELGARGPLSAAIGPGAGPCCYEVSEDVRAAFDEYGPEVLRGANLDLKTIARRQLQRAGVDAVHDVGLCTICSDRSLFYSHRRDGGITGRQAGIAWLT